MVLGNNSSGNGQLSPAQAAQLAGHPAWQRSGFEALERFIFQFLTGGPQRSSNSAGGARAAGVESVRLKLEVGWAVGGVGGGGGGLRQAEG